jgi:hypothetical protein
MPENHEGIIHAIAELARSINAPWHQVNRCAWILAKGKLDETRVRQALGTNDFYIDAVGDVLIRID